MEPPQAQHQTGSHHSVRNHTGPSFYDELTREGQDENDVEVTSLRSVSVRLPPKPQFQFVQDNQVSKEILVGRGIRKGANRCKQVLFTTSHILSLEKSRHVVSLLPALPLHRGFPTFLVGFSLRDCNVVSIVPLWSTTRNQPMHVQILPVNGKYKHIFENLIDQPV